MNENFYQTTRQTILQKHKERIAQADADRDEDLKALEKLRPYWESLPMAHNSKDVDAPEDKPKTSGSSNINKTATEANTIGQRSDFPKRVRFIVEQHFLPTDDIMQPLIHEKLASLFPADVEDIDEANIRSRISKALKRMTKHGVLEVVGKSSSLGNALIYRKKAKNSNTNQFNFDEPESSKSNLDDRLKEDDIEEKMSKQNG